MHITRRHLQVCLGALWLLDGALQCQPFMFSRGFVHTIIDPAVHAAPSILSGPLHFATSLVSQHPALTNSGFAAVQIAIGLVLLTRRWTRVALGVSIVWALSVWVMGEGLGGVTSGATMLAGAPGAALLYAMIALLAWPTGDSLRDESPSRLVIPAWCLLWLSGATLQLIGGNDSASSFSMMLRSAQSSSVEWISGIDGDLARLRIPGWSAAAVIALYVLVAIWSLVPGWTRQLSIAFGGIIALTGWLLFQGLGDLTSGQSTDPNTGPLIVILAFAVAGSTHSRETARPPVTFAERSALVALANSEISSSATAKEVRQESSFSAKGNHDRALDHESPISFDDRASVVATNAMFEWLREACEMRPVDYQAVS